MKAWLRKLDLNDPDRFQKVAAGFQSIVFALGLIFAGVYTFSTFWVLRQKEIAKGELEALNRKLQTKVIDLQVEARQENILVDSDGARYLSVAVSAANKGSKAVALDLSATPPISVAKVVFGPQEGGPTSFGPVIRANVFAAPDSNRRIGKQTIEPTEVYRYNTIIRLNNPGIYIVIFDVTVQSSDLSGNESLATDLHWLSSTYTTVR